MRTQVIKAEDRNGVADLRTNTAALVAVVDPRSGYDLMVIGETLSSQIHRADNLTIKVHAKIERPFFRGHLRAVRPPEARVRLLLQPRERVLRKRFAENLSGANTVDGSDVTITQHPQGQLADPHSEFEWSPHIFDAFYSHGSIV